MKLFDGFKKLFRKEIKLDKESRGKIVSLAKLKGGRLKFGDVLKVEDGYKAVTVYYNNVLDILPAGAYEIKETTVPKLFMLFFRGLKKSGTDKIPEYIKDCELYFVNEQEQPNFKFDIKFKTFSTTNNAKVKCRAVGDFSIKVSDVEKFMIYLCSTYPVVQNSKVLDEINFIVKTKFVLALSGGEYSLEDYFVKGEKICDKAKIDMKADMIDFGFEVSDINFLDIKVPKKFLALKVASLQKKVDIINNKPGESTAKVETSDGITPTQKQTSERVSPTQDTSDNEEFVDIDTLYQDFKKTEQENEINREASPPIVEEKPQKQPETDLKRYSLHREGKSKLYDLVDDYKISDAPQKNPMLFSEPVKKKTEEVKVVVKKLVTCPCCGAKNYEGDQLCCVCKSKL